MCSVYQGTVAASLGGVGGWTEWDTDIRYFPLQKTNKINNSCIKCGSLFLSFKEITEICGKKSSEVPKAEKGDYFSPNEAGGILPSTLVLKGMFRFCIIPRC